MSDDDVEREREGEKCVDGDEDVWSESARRREEEKNGGGGGGSGVEKT